MAGNPDRCDVRLALGSLAVAKIADLLAEGRTYSFEFFPPKTVEARATLVHTLRELQRFEPSFVSITYGAGGSTRDLTHDLVVGLAATTAMTPMAHLTCAAHSRLDLAEIVVRYARAGIENLLALAGDPSQDPDAPATELHHAIELVELVRAVAPLSIGVAAHPEGHPRSTDLATDRRHLADKLRVADFAITQFFFDADHYFRMVEDLASLGVHKPVLPGVMPVQQISAISRMAAMSGATIPDALLARLHDAEARGGADAVRAVGIEHATELCRTLLDGGAPGLHLYTLNRSTATQEIYANLGIRGA